MEIFAGCCFVCVAREERTAEIAVRPSVRCVALERR